MPAETDLARMLATLEVQQVAGEFAFLSVEDASPLRALALASIREREGWSVIVPIAAVQGRPVEFRAAWLTLAVHSDLAAVGLTAAFAAALSARAIPCNVVAGFFHDHLFVPAERVADALAALNQLRSSATSCT